MGTAMALLSAARIANAKLPPKEREQCELEREAARLERVRQAQIIQNVCPNCEGKLARGKKNKKNEYKRDWKCEACGDTHSL